MPALNIMFFLLFFLKSNIVYKSLEPNNIFVQIKLVDVIVMTVSIVLNSLCMRPLKAINAFRATIVRPFCLSFRPKLVAKLERACVLKHILLLLSFYMYDAVGFKEWNIPSNLNIKYPS